MIDPYVLLTPILLLGVIALLRFVGCDIVLGLEEPSGKISKIEPNLLTACGTFTVFGDGFVSESSVQWDLTPLLTTHFVLATKLKVDVDLALGDTIPNTAQVTVVNPDRSSDPFTFNFNVIPGNPNSVNIALMPLPRGINSDPVQDGDVPNINFTGWIWFQDAPNQTAIYFDSIVTARTFTFVNGPRILQSMRVRRLDFAPTPMTITVTNEKGESTPPLSILGGQFPLLNTGWVKCSQTVTVTLTPASDRIGIVELTYLGPP